MKIPAIIFLITTAAAVSFGSLTDEYREAAAAVDANAASETRPSANEAKLATVTEALLMKAPIDELRQVVGQLDVMSASSQQTLKKILELLRGRNSEIEVSRFSAVLLASSDWKQDPKDDFPRGMIVINNFRSTAGPLLLARIGLRDLPLGEKRLDLLLYHADQWLEFAFEKATAAADPVLLDEIAKARSTYSGGSSPVAHAANNDPEAQLRKHEELMEGSSQANAMQSDQRNFLVWGAIGAFAVVLLVLATSRLLKVKK